VEHIVFGTQNPNLRKLLCAKGPSPSASVVGGNRGDDAVEEQTTAREQQQLVQVVQSLLGQKRQGKDYAK